MCKEAIMVSLKTKLLSLLCCLVFVLPLLTLPVFALTPTEASDVDGDGVVTARDAAILARYVAGWDGYVDEFGSLTYPWRENVASVRTFDPEHPVYFKDGYTFRVLVFGGNDNGTQLVNGETRKNFSATHFSVKDVCPWTEGSWSDCDSYAKHYTKISQVVEERNQYLLDRYNITVVEERVHNTFDILKTDSFCGLHPYDAVMLPASGFYNQATVGLLTNVYDIPTIDLEREWYDNELLSTFSFGNTLYYLTGASDSAIRQSVFLPSIGLTNVQKSYGYKTVTAAANFIYDTVLEGKWTVDKMIEVVNTCYAQYSGKSNHYKVTAETRINTDQMISAGFVSVINQNGKYTFYDTFSSCPNYSAWESLKEIFSGEERAKDTYTNIYTGTTSETVIRYIGNTVYLYSGAYSNTGNYIAILPDAKSTVDQEYNQNPGMGYCYLYTIPKCNHADAHAPSYGFESGAALAGYVMSAFMEASLGKHNTKGYDVRDAYIQQLAALGSLHNDAFQGKPLETLNLIFDSVHVDRGMLLSSDLYNLFRNVVDWDSVEDSYDKSIKTYQGYAANIQEYLALE